MRRPTPSWSAVAATLALLAIPVACTGDPEEVTPTTSVGATTTTTVVREQDGVLTIGLYLPQTGPGAALGEGMIAAAVETIRSINERGGVLGSPIRFEILDEGGATGPDTLLSAGVDAIVGPASSRTALSQLGALTQPGSGVVTCSPTATALALDAYPDNGYFFRTVPSDALQMTAISRRVERTGVPTLAIGFLDDPYGRGLATALTDDVVERDRLEIVASVPFGADQENLTQVAAALVAEDPGVVVVLGDADDGGRLLAALDSALVGDIPQIIVNDSIRTAATIQQLSEPVRSQLTGIAPLASTEDWPAPFASHTADCVNLIALSALEAGTDRPSDIRIQMAPVSSGGRQCTSFDACALLVEDEGLQIDYNGSSGPIELSTSTGDPTRATFLSFGFDEDGLETDPRRTDVP